AAATGAPEVHAVRNFLRADPVPTLALAPGYDPGEAVTFSVDGRLVTDVPAVQGFWSEINYPSQGQQPARVMQCLVCGQERPVLDRLDEKLKGVPGGQTSGTALISANSSAFESYGLQASLVAPTCATCGERFTKAANALLAGERSRI